MVARLKRPIHFDSVDAKPAELVFLRLTLATAEGEHLAALAAVSRHLRHKEFAARSRGASSIAAWWGLLCDSRHS
ncbi:MAG: PTS sugar transporter subunit IIA [Methylocella sp.]